MTTSQLQGQSQSQLHGRRLASQSHVKDFIGLIEDAIEESEIAMQWDEDARAAEAYLQSQVTPGYVRLGPNGEVIEGKEIDEVDPEVEVVPELEDVEEFLEENTRKRTNLYEGYKGYEGESVKSMGSSGSNRYMIGEYMAKEWNPFVRIGHVDMIKEGFVRIRQDDFTRWFPNHEVIHWLQETSSGIKPKFDVNWAVCLARECHRILGRVAYFSPDGETTYVKGLDADETNDMPPVAYRTEDLKPYDPDWNPYDYNPLIDNPEFFNK